VFLGMGDMCGLGAGRGCIALCQRMVRCRIGQNECIQTGGNYGRSSVGTTVEWYDYFIYGTAAALVFGPLFFPEFDPVARTLAAFPTFAVGFLARPLGGVAFGHLGIA
jgi:hypothetical protein